MIIRHNILITGASSGLGEGLAREYARLGRNLALCARRTDRLDALKAELEAAHPAIKIFVRALDVNNHEQVFEVFRAFQADLGTIDRIIVNAGMGKGASLGTGYFHANLQTAQTNFVAALAQCEAALEIFRAQNAGHLVTISSVAAMRGMPRAQTTYAATKAGLSALSEGIRADLLGSPHQSQHHVPRLYPLRNQRQGEEHALHGGYRNRLPRPRQGHRARARAGVCARLALGNHGPRHEVAAAALGAEAAVSEMEENKK